MFWRFIAGCPKFTSDTQATALLPYSQNGKQACKHMLALTHTNTKSLVFLFWKLDSVQKLVVKYIHWWWIPVTWLLHPAQVDQHSSTTSVYASRTPHLSLHAQRVLENYHCKRTIVLSSAILQGLSPTSLK